MTPSPYTDEMRQASISARQHAAVEAREYTMGEAVYWQTHAPNPEFVYFIQASGADGDYEGPVKIGYARDPHVRLGELQVGNPAYLSIRTLVLGDRQAERWYHQHWKDCRVRGEWFGAGFEHFIVALAEETGRRQIELHKAGDATPEWLAREAHAWVADDAQMERWRAAA